jgi:hypothetical protein
MLLGGGIYGPDAKCRCQVGHQSEGRACARLVSGENQTGPRAIALGPVCFCHPTGQFIVFDKRISWDVRGVH